MPGSWIMNEYKLFLHDISIDERRIQPSRKSNDGVQAEREEEMGKECSLIKGLRQLFWLQLSPFFNAFL